MALNDEYFGSIKFERFWNKYYSSSRVDAVLNDIRRRAAACARTSSGRR